MRRWTSRLALVLVCSSGKTHGCTGGLSPRVAPEVLGLVRPGGVKRRGVCNRVLNHTWARDIVGELSVDAVMQFLRLWNAVEAVLLSDHDDEFVQKWMEDFFEKEDNALASASNDAYGLYYFINRTDETSDHLALNASLLHTFGRSSLDVPALFSHPYRGQLASRLVA
ncbi:hypothetical protein QYE76_060869 [Lolium multiflorum]|uniref:Uncharacterized protein n=1 Tax=Lolium multiflorum TaxID=4521 RepID=A0AAD8RZX4_LOLMU|nr:hypothetical protein QYE76_060869 [Lolium multiflorum]